jgi:segregation and condensation protein A
MEQNGTQFKLQEFEGPLDLLLFLIRKSEINIYDIPISEITEQYLQYLQYATRIDLDDLTEFYVMATTLLYIKSRMLLPIEFEPDEDIEDPRKELVEKLIEYQKYKKLSDLMAEKEQDAEWIIDRKKKQIPLPFPESDGVWDQIDVWDLLKSFSRLVSTLSAERIIDLYEEVSINEKISLIHEFLETRKEFSFMDLVTQPRSVMDLVCSFLAVLESVKSRRVRIFQNRLFGDIRIQARQEDPEEKQDHSMVVSSGEQ